VPDSIVDAIGSALADQPAITVLRIEVDAQSYRDDWLAFLRELSADYPSALEPALQKLILEAPRPNLPVLTKSVVQEAYSGLGFPGALLERALTATTVSGVAKIDAFFTLYALENPHVRYEGRPFRPPGETRLTEQLGGALGMAACAAAAEMVRSETPNEGAITRSFARFMYFIQALALDDLAAAQNVFADPLVTRARGRLSGFVEVRD
jgi:hypothetical protein